jgi:hypothetical protein
VPEDVDYYNEYGILNKRTGTVDGFGRGVRKRPADGATENGGESQGGGAVRRSDDCRNGIGPESKSVLKG